MSADIGSGDVSPRRVADELYARDRASAAMGMRIAEVELGRAVLEMEVRHEMTNGHDICHGGFIFTLADSAFAFACNSGNENTVAAGASIDFVRPARLGQVLRAEAVERHRSGRNGFFEVEVCDEDGELVALFHGRSRTIGGQIVGGHD